MLKVLIKVQTKNSLVESGISSDQTSNPEKDPIDLKLIRVLKLLIQVQTENSLVKLEISPAKK